MERKVFQGQNNIRVWGLDQILGFISVFGLYQVTNQKQMMPKASPLPALGQGGSALSWSGDSHSFRQLLGNTFIFCSMNTKKIIIFSHESLVVGIAACQWQLLSWWPGNKLIKSSLKAKILL